MKYTGYFSRDVRDLTTKTNMKIYGDLGPILNTLRDAGCFKILE